MKTGGHSWKTGLESEVEVSTREWRWRTTLEDGGGGGWWRTELEDKTRERAGVERAGTQVYRRKSGKKIRVKDNTDEQEDRK